MTTSAWVMMILVCGVISGYCWWLFYRVLTIPPKKDDDEERPPFHTA